MKNNSFDDIFNVIKSKKNIVIVTHTSPDGDAVAAATALSMGLETLGISITILTEKIDNKYDIIPYNKVNVEYIEDNTFNDLKCDLFISVDCGDKNRFKDVVTLFDNAENTINIDHHMSNDYFAEYNYVSLNVSSTSEIMFSFLEQFNLLNENIATGLYAGIVFDTGGFMHSCTRQSTFIIASKLLGFGIDNTEIYRRIMYCKTLEENRATAYVLSNMILLENGICYLTINYKDFENIGLPTEAFNNTVNSLFNTNGVKIAFTAFEKKEGLTKISLRARNFNVNAIAAVFGGGGHRLASGCAIDKNATEATSLILKEIKIDE